MKIDKKRKIKDRVNAASPSGVFIFRYKFVSGFTNNNIKIKINRSDSWIRINILMIKGVSIDINIKILDDGST